ncbi:hypothetical protein D1872_230810 [compost metagenome]
MSTKIRHALRIGTVNLMLEAGRNDQDIALLDFIAVLLKLCGLAALQHPDHLEGQMQVRRHMPAPIHLLGMGPEEADIPIQHRKPPGIR